MKDAAREQIEYQMRKNDMEEDEMPDRYASRVAVPTFAYLGRDGFKGEFQENGLINGYTYEALSSCI